MRFFTVILLILLSFFGGMMYGTFEMKQSDTGPDRSPEGEVMQMEPFQPEEMNEVPEAITVDRNMSMDKNVPFIHRVAALFEKLVISIYEVCLEMLYKIADAFF